MNFWYQLGASDFARLLGNSTEESAVLLSQNQYDFGYRCLTREERDHLIIRVLDRIEVSDSRQAGPEDIGRWEKGWQENLDNFVASNYDIRELTPKYIRSNEPIRLFGDYVMPYDSNFEFNFYFVFREWLFKKYLADANAIYEFGCGPAHNLVALAEMYPDKELYGLEWVSAPLEIMNLLRKRKGYKITGHLFDMFSPDEKLDIKPNSAILTINSLEQLGVNFGFFLDFVMRKKPAIVVDVGSLQELYDENNLSDYLASRFVRHRNYLQGYVTRLRELESSGRIEILKIQKISCGSICHDAYSYIVWRPKSEARLVQKRKRRLPNFLLRPPE